MAIETDLSVAPYFDDTIHGLDNNYYKILFKPSVPVQVRELNELQSILQNQIEEFSVTFSYDYWIPVTEQSDKKAGGVNLYGVSAVTDGPLGP